MARKSTNGSVADITVEILKDIRTELRALKKTTAEGFAAMNGRLDATNGRLDTVVARLENLRDPAGDRYRDHEDRIRTLERRLDEGEGHRT